MISQFQPGQSVTDFFILRHKELRTKKGSSETYLSLELGDCSGRVFASLWQDVDAANEQIKPGHVVKVRGNVIDYHGRPHLAIDKIRPSTAADKIDAASFLPHSKTALKTLFSNYCAHVEHLEQPFLKQVMFNIVNNPNLVEKIKKAPGGKLWHHCYVGGFLEHTLHVVELAKLFASYYQNVNVDLLITAALLHDIGKIYEYQANGFIDYSDKGRLHGHIVLGYHLVADIIQSIPDFPESLSNELLHLILSHQGKQEHGSPTVPMTREAMILNAIDELDAKLGAFDRIYEREYEKGKSWSNYVNLLDRFLYFGTDHIS